MERRSSIDMSRFSSVQYLGYKAHRDQSRRSSLDSNAVSIVEKSNKRNSILTSTILSKRSSIDASDLFRAASQSQNVAIRRASIQSMQNLNKIPELNEFNEEDQQQHDNFDELDDKNLTDLQKKLKVL